ncbi:MAG: MBL fold metallo-hydrolase [Candidatus Sericytochromatia bacterium]
MANILNKHPKNIDGNFFVDTSCIDCDTCRWIAPEVFNDNGEQSIVYHQPENQEQKIKALQALLSCPTASIGLEYKDDDILNTQKSFPLKIDENVFYCGFHSKKSFGASSYFIKRNNGNILIDSPRFVSSLVKNIEDMGGIKYMFLTHIDDIAEHEKFKEHFNCQRIIHIDDAKGSLNNPEIKLIGNEDFNIDDDIKIINVTGHTKGHCVLLYKDKFLFTGDHLAWSDRLNQLIAFRGACWYSWEELVNSMEKLLNYNFEWILPGHGRRFNTSKEKMKMELKKCIHWCKKR